MTCRLIVDEGSVVIAVEDDNPDGTAQALWVRVGPVYDHDALRDEPGVWVNYQENYMQADLDGPVLLTPDAWRELVREVNARLRRAT